MSRRRIATRPLSIRELADFVGNIALIRGGGLIISVDKRFSSI